MIIAKEGTTLNKRVYARVTFIRAEVSPDTKDLLTPLLQSGGIYPVQEITWPNDPLKNAPSSVTVTVLSEGSMRWVIIPTACADVELLTP